MSNPGNGKNVAAAPPGRNTLSNVVTLLVTVLLCLLVLEVFARVLAGTPLLEFKNWRYTKVISGDLAGVSAPNEILGWQVKPFHQGDTFNTIEYGIRKNHAETKLVTGGVLAVGDSFAAGSEVADWESWPAYLEEMLGQPVMNAGVGAYGTDQILMRAEQLLPILEPRTLVVGFLQDDIQRAGYSSYSWPKPYFTIENDELVHHPPGMNLSHEKAEGIAEAASRFALRWGGYSQLLHSLFGRLAPQFWLASEGQVYRRVNIDEVEVTCALLKRVKKTTDALGVRMLLLMQYGGGHHSSLAPPTGHAQLVMDCAQEAGVQVVNELESLQAVVRDDPNRLRDYYVMHGDAHGHMSATGNRHVASLINDALQQEYDATPREDSTPVTPTSADMPEYDDLETRIQGSSIMKVEKIGGLISSYTRLSSIGPRGEHYVGIGGIESPPGKTTFSMLARLSDESGSSPSAAKLRIQMWDGDSEGVFADFDLISEEAALARKGRVLNLRSSIDSEGWSWKRITVSARFSGSGRTLYIQLMDSAGKSAYEGDGRSIEIQDLKLY